MTWSHRLLLLLTFAGPVAAQPAPQSGETVRLALQIPALHGTESVTGTFDAVGLDSLYLVETAYPLGRIRGMEVARGTHTQALVGAAVGGGIGGLTGGLLGARSDFANVTRVGDRSVWVRDALIGTATGALVGGLLGSFFRRTRWERIPLDAPSER